MISNSAPILASVTDWWHEIVSLECEATPESFLFVVINKKVFCNREDPVRVLGVRTVEKILRADSESRIPHQFYIEDCHGKRWSMKAMRKNGELLLFAHPGVLPFSITPRELDIASWLVGGCKLRKLPGPYKFLSAPLRIMSKVCCSSWACTTESRPQFFVIETAFLLCDEQN